MADRRRTSTPSMAHDAATTKNFQSLKGIAQMAKSGEVTRVSEIDFGKSLSSTNFQSLGRPAGNGSSTPAAAPAQPSSSNTPTTPAPSTPKR